MKHVFLSCRSKFVSLLLLLFPLFAAPSLQAGNLAEAEYNLLYGELCFPLEFPAIAPATAPVYKVCLRQTASTPALKFVLQSAMPYPAGTTLPSRIPQYSQQTGVKLPVVRLSDGRVYADAQLGVTQQVGGGIGFEVKSARRLVNDSHSVARLWNEALLGSIRGDLARPTVHARNLFHSAVAMYDAWAAFDGKATPYLLGKTRNGYTCAFAGMAPILTTHAARNEAISYAAYGLLKARFTKSPGAIKSLQAYEDLMLVLGYDSTFSSRDFSKGSAAALGNYIADCVIAYGLQDGSNEAGGYASKVYKAINLPFYATQPSTTITDPDRWQPLSFNEFRDQNGNLFAGSTPPALTPEWGDVAPFAMGAANLATHERAGKQWKVWHDPGKPPLMADPLTADDYKWGFELVAIWSGQLTSSDNVLWDISPGGIGNNTEYPTTLKGYRDFYNLLGGGDRGKGYSVNPVTGKSYTPQIVARGDFARVLAEFWADGPQSETPPGHWFTVLNYVVDHPLFTRQFKGAGNPVDSLEWDVKAYMALGGAMHDAAIAAWGVKGYYDYVRPISAIRYLAAQGQSSDPAAASYNPKGIHLVPGYIELIKTGDPLAGNSNEHVGKIKLKAWLAHDKIQNGATDQAGVGWMRAELWYPYQRPSFVTPPFAGYVSGHSTYSRAAAEVLTLLTGSEYFPGGLGEFVAKKNEYLVFEEGPSQDIVLQWARYRDAADQSSLSRIWGGIHPPQDDIPGRRIGAVVGVDAFNKAEKLFNGIE
ncbi:MAG: vanadium-dependent haloperoxidase [Pseudomonadota bacterium]